MTKGKKIAIVAGILVVIFCLMLIDTKDKDYAIGNKQQTDQKSEKPSQSDKDIMVDKVRAALSEFDDDFKSSLAATSVGGLQGDIVGVKPYSDDGVIIEVSTNFSKPGDEEGKMIANKIFGNICLDVPELDTLYVTSTTSGLDSQSVYRSDYPGCKTN